MIHRLKYHIHIIQIKNKIKSNYIRQTPSKNHGKKLLMSLKMLKKFTAFTLMLPLKIIILSLSKMTILLKNVKKLIENEQEEINLNKINNEEKIEGNSQMMLSDIDTMLKEIQKLKSIINDLFKK